MFYRRLVALAYSTDNTFVLVLYTTELSSLLKPIPDEGRSGEEQRVVKNNGSVRSKKKSKQTKGRKGD